MTSRILRKYIHGFQEVALNDTYLAFCAHLLYNFLSVLFLSETSAWESLVGRKKLPYTMIFWNLKFFVIHVMLLIIWLMFCFQLFLERSHVVADNDKITSQLWGCYYTPGTLIRALHVYLI